ncbi:hypothetical protein B9S53_02100 [Arthrospira sp. O9.13F]|uniref:Uncharacterized protein n=1 Tax=Limnospira indica PCC 8005 TaxID=376219 RepID=A0A9P1P245_9CYAN|nr:hypothetical protein B9S53_02100 [Arthrospira sp. O9.13F]CDM98588.1 hypothetical protein ARTHRO_61189 [Limnospira indica PCC 8005]
MALRKGTIIASAYQVLVKSVNWLLKNSRKFPDLDKLYKYFSPNNFDIQKIVNNCCKIYDKLFSILDERMGVLVVLGE